MPMEIEIYAASGPHSPLMSSSAPGDLPGRVYGGVHGSAVDRVSPGTEAK